jgi:hypothetical protein
MKKSKLDNDLEKNILEGDRNFTPYIHSVAN